MILKSFHSRKLGFTLFPLIQVYLNNVMKYFTDFYVFYTYYLT